MPGAPSPLENGSIEPLLSDIPYGKDEHRIHEAQKPVRLVSFLIDLTTKEGQTVLDPFMGSGTTAVAAKRLDRRFIGFEAADDFHKAANQRLRDEDGREGIRDRSQPLLL